MLQQFTCTFPNSYPSRFPPWIPPNVCFFPTPGTQRTFAFPSSVNTLSLLCSKINISFRVQGKSNIEAEISSKSNASEEALSSACLLWTNFPNRAMVLMFNDILISYFCTVKLTCMYDKITSRENINDVSKRKFERHHHFETLDYFLLYSNSWKNKDFLHWSPDFSC